MGSLSLSFIHCWCWCILWCISVVKLCCCTMQCDFFWDSWTMQLWCCLISPDQNGMKQWFLCVALHLTKQTTREWQHKAALKENLTKLQQCVRFGQVIIKNWLCPNHSLWAQQCLLAFHFLCVFIEMSFTFCLQRFFHPDGWRISLSSVVLCRQQNVCCETFHWKWLCMPTTLNDLNLGC